MFDKPLRGAVAALLPLLLLAWPAGGDAFFVAGATRAPALPPSPAASALHRAHACGRCHRGDGADAEHAPPLQPWGRRSYVAGARPDMPMLLTLWIVDAPALPPRSPLPSLRIGRREAQPMEAPAPARL